MIFNGIPGPNKTVITLSPMDQQICILARPKLIRAQFEPGGAFEWVVSEDWGELCEDDECQIARLRYIRDLLLCGKIAGF
jgi:hypothetical protein